MISTSSEGEGQHKTMHNDNTSNVSYVLFSEVRHFPKHDESLIAFFYICSYQCICTYDMNIESL